MFHDATKGEIMSDETLENENTPEVVEEATPEVQAEAPAKKTVAKKEAPKVEPVAQEPTVQPKAAQASPVGWSWNGYCECWWGPYSMFSPWATAQNGDVLSYSTAVNGYDWAGAVVYQNGQYNTTQRGY
jgi:hypothetical protein